MKDFGGVEKFFPRKMFKLPPVILRFFMEKISPSLVSCPFKQIKLKRFRSTMLKNKNHAGFTLLEILIALFIFTVLSMILVGALHSVMNADAGTAKNAQRLRNLQLALVIMSREIEQTVNRPILNTSGSQEPAFIGTPRIFKFTHTGFANPTGELMRSSLQRTEYLWSEGILWRKTWPVLDQAHQSLPMTRPLLGEVTDASFQYLDDNGRFQKNWPPPEGQENPLPRAVRVNLTISNWGKMSQLYVVSAEATDVPQEPPKP